MSARAAWRLEGLGFERVYRYQAGKEDWLAARLPTEGRQAGVRRAADAARPDVPTCRPGDCVRAVREEIEAGGWPLVVVANEHGVILGRLRPRDLDAHPEAVAEEIMVEGPRTVRGTRPVEELADWLDERRVPGVLVTSADGVLIGYVRREDV